MSKLSELSKLLDEMSFDRSMTSKQLQLWKLAEKIKAAAEHTRMTRNPDAEVRKQFKVDRDIKGTRAWALTQVLGLANAGRNDPRYSDDNCDEIIAVLSGASNVREHFVANEAWRGSMPEVATRDRMSTPHRDMSRKQKISDVMLQSRIWWNPDAGVYGKPVFGAFDEYIEALKYKYDNARRFGVPHDEAMKGFMKIAKERLYAVVVGFEEGIEDLEKYMKKDR